MRSDESADTEEPLATPTVATVTSPPPPPRDPPLESEQRKPSAPLAMGVLSGVLAAVVVVPMALPLQYQVDQVETAFQLRQVSAAANVAVGLWQRDNLAPGTTSHLDVDHISVSEPGTGRVVHEVGPPFPTQARDRTCALPGAARLDTLPNGQRWAMSCVRDEAHLVFVARAPDRGTAWYKIWYNVFLMALIVGIVTALGVLRVLSPLSRVKGALERVGAGERGVQVAATGFSELDELVDRVNAAARAMEDREDAILARISVVQELARMVAHEVRNPLQSIELLTSLLAAEDDAEERRTHAGVIHQEIRSLDNVVTRILKEGSSTGALRLQLHERSLRPLIGQVITLRRPEARARGVRLSARDLHDQVVPLDSALLGRCIENLVVNAMQAVESERGVVEIRMIDEEDYIGFIVDDNGIGIPDSIRDQIFEPKVSGRSGTGLGLALVKGVIEAHGGYIETGRSPLGGARFVVRIARSPANMGVA